MDSVKDAIDRLAFCRSRCLRWILKGGVATGMMRGSVTCCASHLSRPTRPKHKEAAEHKRPSPSHSPGASKVIPRRPDPRSLQSALDEEATARKLVSNVSQIDPFLTQGITEHVAREALERVDEALRHFHILDDRALMFLAETIGTIRQRSPLKPVDTAYTPVLDRLTVAVADRFQDLSTSDMCLLVWVYGSFGPSVLLPSMFQGVQQLMNQMCMRVEGADVESVEDVVRLFYGLQKLKFSPRTDVTYQTLRKLGPVLKTQGFCVLDVAKLVLLSAKLRVRCAVEFLRTASRLVRNRFGEFTDEALLDFVRGSVILDFKTRPRLFDSFTREVARRLWSMDVTCLIEIMLCLSKINYLPDEGVLKDFSQRVLMKINYLNPNTVACCAQAVGHLDFYSPELMEALTARFLNMAPSFDIVQICHMLLGYIRLNALTEEVLMAGLAVVRDELPRGIGKKPQKMILHQVLTHAKLFLKLDSIPSEIFPKEWQSACRHEWIEDQKRPVYSTEASVMKIAKKLRLEIRTVGSPIGDITTCIFSSADGEGQVVFDLVIEKQHCFTNHKEKLLPWKRWQYHVLEAQGLNVLAIRESQWKQVPKISKLRHLGRKVGFWSLEELIAMEEEMGIRKRR